MFQRLVTATCDHDPCDQTISMDVGSITEAIVRLRYEAANGQNTWIVPAGRPTGGQRTYCSYEHYVETEPTVARVESGA